MSHTCSLTGLKARWMVTLFDDTKLPISSERLMMRWLNERAGTSVRENRMYEVMLTHKRMSPEIADMMTRAGVKSITCLTTSKVCTL